MRSLLRRIASKTLGKYLPKRIFYNSYSQAGEDRILSFLFETTGITNPSYLDIGTNIPDHGNNTFLFYLKSPNGVCVEADPILCERIRLVRPKDICLNVAIGVGSEEATFYIFEEPSLNTLSFDEVGVRTASGKQKIKDTIKVKVVSLESIIDNHLKKIPTFISLDVEGVDLEILKRFDHAKYKVPIWVVETVEYSENHIKEKIVEIHDLMLANGYFVYADTYINTIYVSREWFFNLQKKDS